MTDVAVAIGLVSEAMSKIGVARHGFRLGFDRPLARRAGVGDRSPPADQHDRAGNLSALDGPVDRPVDPLEPIGVKAELRRAQFRQASACSHRRQRENEQPHTTE